METESIDSKLVWKLSVTLPKLLIFTCKKLYDIFLFLSTVFLLVQIDGSSQHSDGRLIKGGCLCLKCVLFKLQVPDKPFELVEREIPEPKNGTVRIKVHSCGICHSDSFTKEGTWPGIKYPRVPGHEIAGTIDALGPDVENWKIGQRVGVGWHGANCFHCESCRRGDFVLCSTLQTPESPMMEDMRTT